MKSIKYSVLGLFILSLVFVAGNSFSQVSNWWAAGQGKYIMEHLRKFGGTGAGGPIKLYGQTVASCWDTVAASTMIWSQLRTLQGDYVAEIKDLVIDPVSGRISDVVLTHIRGMGAKNVVVPFSTVSKTGWNIFVFNAPEGANQFHGESPYWSEGFYLYTKEQRPMESYTTQKLISAFVQTPKGEDLGRIDDLVIDSTNGHIVYLVVSDTGGKEGKRVAIPFNVLSKSGENAFVLNTTRQELEAAPAFTWSDMTN